MIKKLPGVWHLQYSTFPMWQKDGVHSITFHYTATELNGSPALLDEVKYFKKDTAKTVTGYDRPAAANAFTWRGKGLLGLFQSKWRVEWMSEDQTVLVISFDKTWVTPAGLDILTRDDADAGLLVRAQEIVRERSLLAGVRDPLLPVSL